MLNFNSILIFSEDPARLVEFYTDVFEREPSWTGGGFSSFQVGNGFITIGPHDKVQGDSQQPERIMLNFETENIESEFERISDLGAQVIAKPYSPMESEEGLIATFADPDGNYFQLMSPMMVEDEEPKTISTMSH